jgi:cytochrome P450
MSDVDAGLKAVGYIKSTAPVDPAAPRLDYARLMGTTVQPIPELLQSYDSDVSEHVLRHHEMFSNAFDMSLGNTRPVIPLNVDPPRHSRYRKLLDPIFAPRKMNLLEPFITRRVNDLIDGFVDDCECNFTDQFAEVFPTTVFLDLLGIEQSELGRLLRLRDGILHPERIDPVSLTNAERRREIALETGRQVYAFFGDVIERRSARPDGIIAGLSAEVEGQSLSTDEVVDLCYGLMIAGLDTVSDALTLFFAFLATHPAHREQLGADPAVIPSAIEELLRWETPVTTTTRRVVVDDVLPNGCPVTAGMTVALSLGALNADPTRFESGDEVCFDRSPNPHVAFGAGVHRCLGSHLARREILVTMREWHRRIPAYWLKPGHEVLDYPSSLRHVKDLTLAWASTS